MKKQKENVFFEKFRLLNSQEYSEEINWSSSSPSDYENVDNRIITNITNRKRKLKKKKDKSFNNISNLDITITDCTQDAKIVKNDEKSPILCTTIKSEKSPILTAKNIESSPILTSRSILNSPILLSKSSPRSAVKVKKKLFNNNSNSFSRIKSENASTKNSNIPNLNSIIDNIKQEVCSDVITQNSCNFNDARINLVKKVSSFFDSNFGSQNSEHSIHDTTDASSKSDDVEILSCKSHNGTPLPIKKESSTTSTDTFDEDKRKKIKYKKGGLAYRLADLLRKQNAKTSLWHHERYLAENSNFVIPKEEYTAYRIKKVNFKYGIYVLDCLNFDNTEYIILINKCYVNENILEESVLKLYKPFNLMEYDRNCKLIVNVCKFEHICIKNEKEVL